VIAAFGDFQIGVVFGRELDALWRHQVDERIVRLRQVRVHGFQHCIGGVRSGDREHPRMRLPDDVALGAEAAGDDDLAVLVQRFADRLKRFPDRRIDEPAGVDDHQVRLRVIR
jgi:hypothetical protein